MIKIRCSALPAFMSCPSSQEPCLHPVNPNSEAADLGTATHEALNVLVHDLTPDLLGIARKHHVDHEELAKLFGYGAKAWLEIQTTFPGDIIAEEQMALEISPELTLTGKADLVTPTPVIDWKSGRVRYDARWQMEGYGRLTGRRSAFAVWLRYHDTDEYELMAPEDFDAALLEQVKLIGEVYNPGSACMFCQKQLECDARQIEARQTVALLKAKPTGGAIETADLVRAYPYLDQIEKACKRFRALLKDNVTANGSMDIGDGYELALSPYQKKTIDVQFSWDILAKHLDKDAMAQCMKITNGAMETELKNVAEKGKKMALVKEVWSDLRAAGAVEEVTVCPLKKRKKVSG